MIRLKTIGLALVILLLTGTPLLASEADLAIPDLKWGTFPTLGGIDAWTILFYGALVICGTLKIAYDIALLLTFRHIKPPEERA